MKSRLAALTVAIAALCAPAAAQAATIKVNVRVEGATKTLFEGRVNTDGHAIDGHPCDGTNGGANPTAGPTHTAALDDASKRGGFDWTRTWNDSFTDFTINSIFDETPAESTFWGTYTNFTFNEVGGCQQRIGAGDEVLFAVSTGSEKHLLKLSGKKTVRVGDIFKLKVIDAATKKPVKGAKLGKLKVPSNGILKLRADKKGTYIFKAEAPDSIRSNAVPVTIKAAKKK